MAKITINDVEYDSETMNETALANLNSIQFVDAEVARLQAQLSVMATARMAYATALQQAMGQANLGDANRDSDDDE